MEKRRSNFFFTFGLLMSFLALFLMNFSSPISALAANLTIKEGTPVALRLEKSINSDTVYVGDPVDLVVARDVKVNGKVVISQGTRTGGEVAFVEEKGLIGKPGKIMITVRSTTAVDGTEVPLRATVTREGKSKQTLAIILGIVLCLFILLMKGESAVIPAGYEIKAYVDYSVDISV